MLSRSLNTLRQRSARNASTLVLADHANASLSPSTLHTITAAKAIGGDISVLVAGPGSTDVAAEVTQIDGVSRVFVADIPAVQNQLSENVCQLLQSIQEKESFTHVVGSTSAVAKGALPRLAAMLDVAAISDVTGVSAEDTFVRPTYAGNAIATVQSADPVKILTVRSTAFEPAAAAGGSADSTPVDSECNAGVSTWVSESLNKSDRPELGSAKVVVSGGRGLGNEENFNMMYSLADKLNAAVGASRAAVDAGYAPNDLQVGQTGKVVAPDLYVAVGISGAIQHLAGMKDSKVIVAINKDPEAPIFEVADYGLVGDLFTELPKLEGAL
jgi:electron transfer flavoprotein alpha subunit